jgi:hypothetical protein
MSHFQDRLFSGGDMPKEFLPDNVSITDKNQVWFTLKRNKLELAFGAAAAAAILLGAKYLAAAFLVFWTLAGGQ